MIVSNEGELAEAVLASMRTITNPRLREILTARVAHLHAFVREVRLTEEEFREATALIARLGQLTDDSYNEVVLMAGSLGISALVCLLNSCDGFEEASTSLLGPFWRLNAPKLPNGASLPRSPTPGPAFVFTGHVRDRRGDPIEDAEVDIWHASPVGLYENQDPLQAEMNLRGKFTTDRSGVFRFSSVLPAGYPIPTEGNVVGQLVRLQRRHNLRPAHIHALIFKARFKTLITQIYMPCDPHLTDDVQFGVRPALIGKLEACYDEKGALCYSMDHSFVMDIGEAGLPKAPID